MNNIDDMEMANGYLLVELIERKRGSLDLPLDNSTIKKATLILGEDWEDVECVYFINGRQVPFGNGFENLSLIHEEDVVSFEEKEKSDEEA